MSAVQQLALWCSGSYWLIEKMLGGIGGKRPLGFLITMVDSIARSDLRTEHDAFLNKLQCSKLFSSSLKPFMFFPSNHSLTFHVYIDLVAPHRFGTAAYSLTMSVNQIL